jgi:RHS repeat-associated protein
MAAQPTLLGLTQTVSADFTSAGNNAAPTFGVVLRCQDCNTAGVPPSNYYRIYRATGGSSLLKISKVVGGVETVLKTTSIPNPAANVQFHLQGSASGTTLTVSVGAVQTSVTDGTFTSGAVGILIHSGGGSTPVHQADNFQSTVAASATAVQISDTSPAGDPTSTGDLTVTSALAVAGPSAEALATSSEGVNSQRELEVGPGMELTRVAESQERRPVERIASLGFAVGGSEHPATGFSLCNVRLFGDERPTSGDFGASGTTMTGMGLGPKVVPNDAGSAASAGVKPKAISTLGRRYSFYSPEMNLLAETEIKTSAGAPAIFYEYIWFNGHPVAQIDLPSTTHWTFTDHLGTPLIQTTAAQGPWWRAEYEPYGRVFFQTADQHQPLRLPGQEAEQLNLGPNGATERSYNIFRWYRPTWGRYTQADPLEEPDTHAFGFVAGNPLRWIDPLGLYHRGDVIIRCDPARAGSCDVTFVWDDPTPDIDDNGDTIILGYGSADKCPTGCPSTAHLTALGGGADPYGAWPVQCVWMPSRRDKRSTYDTRWSDWKGDNPPWAPAGTGGGKQCYDLVNQMTGKSRFYPEWHGPVPIFQPRDLRWWTRQCKPLKSR